MRADGGALPELVEPSSGKLRERLSGWLAGRDGLTLAAGGALVVGTALRLGTGWDQPLWIDETFTGAIAGQPDLAGLLHQLWADVNAPLYYVVMALWSSVAGVSNIALRLPGALFAIGAVLLALRGAPGLDRRLCLLWGALLALWQPGLSQASEARCYALLLLLATAATLALARLLAEPSRRAAFAWAALGSLAILTHYFAAPLVAAQGLIVLLRLRARALPLWPALAAFLPTLAWIGYHAPRLAAFGNPDLAWYGRLEAADLPLIAILLLTSSGGLVLAIALVLVLVRRLRGDTDPATHGTGIVASLVLASALGLGIVLAAGMVRPSFIPRYAIPFMPGLLLGLALAVNAAAPLWPRLPVLAVLLFGLPALLLPGPSRSYSIEAASAAVAQAGARRLVFYWDHPSSPVQDAAQMRAVGGFFLERAGHPVAVTALANPWREDPNPRLIAAAGDDPDAAILWLYDGGLPKTAALDHPPRIATIDPSWRCRDHTGSGQFVALVCLRRPP